MRFIRTKLGAKWKEKKSLAFKLLRAVFFFVPSSNPDYDRKLYLVHEWLIEVDDQDRPFREIGLDVHGVPILAGPDNRNYGFWLDTDMRLSDFEGVEVDRDEFERVWTNYFRS